MKYAPPITIPATTACIILGLNPLSSFSFKGSSVSFFLKVLDAVSFVSLADYGASAALFSFSYGIANFPSFLSLFFLPPPAFSFLKTSGCLTGHD